MEFISVIIISNAMDYTLLAGSIKKKKNYFFRLGISHQMSKRGDMHILRP